MSKLKIELDGETADRIVVDTLKYHLSIIKDDNKQAKKKIKNGEGYPALNEDIAYNENMKIHIKEVLKYFGEN